MLEWIINALIITFSPDGKSMLTRRKFKANLRAYDQGKPVTVCARLSSPLLAKSDVGAVFVQLQKDRAPLWSKYDSGPRHLEPLCDPDVKPVLLSSVSGRFGAPVTIQVRSAQLGVATIEVAAEYTEHMLMYEATSHGDDNSR